MIEVIYRCEVPYSRAVVLSQYFDLEHFEFVHPNSFGRRGNRISVHPILPVPRSWDDTLLEVARLDEAESCRASSRNGTACFPSERDSEDH